MPLRFALALAMLSVTPAAAQTALSAGTPVEADLASGDAHAYTLDLAPGTFVAGHADQHTADMVVTVTGPDGEEVGSFDELARGPEPFQFEAETAGVYTITVSPFEDEAGRYALLVDRVEAVAATPEGVVRQMMASRSGDKVPGAVVTVVRDGEIAYHEAFGMANLTHGIPFGLDTKTNIGSTSKQFTAFAVALLAERGELSLDDDVRDHIPELPDLGETVTLRHLLTHTSGYREFLNALVIAGRPLDRGDAIDRGEILRIVQRQPALQNVPGAEWNYNNSGYALLADVVARVTGEPFPDWMAANVFAPLGMTDTVVRADPTQIVPNSAQGYTPGDAGWREVADLGGAMGAGSIYTTGADLSRWMANLMEPSFAPEVVRQMTERYVLANGDTTSYGLGLFIDEMGGRRLVAHGGADTAHRSQFAFFPDLGAGVIVLTNSPADANSLAFQTARAFFDGAFDAEADEPETPAASGDEVAFDPETFDTYAGRYSLDAAPQFVMTFRRDGDRYFIHPVGQPESEIFATSDSTFESRIVEASLTFHRDADGAVRSLTLHQNGDNRATRLDDTEAEPMDLAAFAGRYFSEELEVVYTFVVEEDELVARHPRTGDTSLSHIEADRFSQGPVTVAFERDESGAVTGFSVDFGRTRDVQFERMD